MSKRREFAAEEKGPPHCFDNWLKPSEKAASSRRTAKTGASPLGLK